jgi:hypothetical protein
VITPWEIWIFKTAFIWSWSYFAYITWGMRFVMSTALFRTRINFAWIMIFFWFSLFFMSFLFNYLFFYRLSVYFFMVCIFIPVSLIHFNWLFFLFNINSFNRNCAWFILFMMMNFFRRDSFFRYSLKFSFMFFTYIFSLFFIFNR